MEKNIGKKIWRKIVKEKELEKNIWRKKFWRNKVGEKINFG
jgi:hypothetical protein